MRKVTYCAIREIESPKALNLRRAALIVFDPLGRFWAMDDEADPQQACGDAQQRVALAEKIGEGGIGRNEESLESHSIRQIAST